MRAFPVVLLSALLPLAIPTVAAQEADETEFVAEPGPGSEVAPTGGYFVIDAARGEEIRQSVGLRNDSDEPVVLELAAVDATTGQLGGASYGLPQDALRGAGAWIVLDRSTVTLAPGASEIVPFDVVVPEDARSGTHLAGLSIAAPAREAEGADAGEGEAGASVDVQTRRVIAVQVELPGPDDPELVVGGVAPAARPDGLYLEIAIENRGSGLTKATGVVTVGDDFTREFDVDTFVPGTKIAYPIKWRASAVEGEYDASVELRYGGEVARWAGELHVGRETLNELGERQVEQSQQTGDERGMPGWVLVGAAGGGAVVVGAAGYALARRRVHRPDQR